MTAAERPALPATPDDRPVGSLLRSVLRDRSAEKPAPQDRADERGASRRPLSAARAWRFRPDRRHLGLVLIAVVAVWLAIVFSRAVTDAAAVNDDASTVRGEIAELERRLDEARRESAKIQSDRFILHRARAFGMGEPGERVFTLAPGAPAPPPITPLGAPPEQPATTPLEDWLTLLFGG